MSVFDAIDALFHRLVAADVQNSQRKAASTRVPRSFQQLVLTFQVTHCCDDFESGCGRGKGIKLFQSQ